MQLKSSYLYAKLYQFAHLRRPYPKVRCLVSNFVVLDGLPLQVGILTVSLFNICTKMSCSFHKYLIHFLLFAICQIQYSLIKALKSSTIREKGEKYGHVNFIASLDSKEELFFAEVCWDPKNYDMVPTCIVSLEEKRRIGQYGITG